jgi:TolB protein
LLLQETKVGAQDKIVFESLRDGNAEIYVMDADGSNLINLTNHPGPDRSPVWSPDGSKIAFHSLGVGDWEVFVMDADGSNLVNLSNNRGTDAAPDWSPDGTRIAFESDRDGNFEMYVMDADGTNQTRLTDDPATDYFPTCHRTTPGFLLSRTAMVILRCTRWMRTVQTW